MGVAYQRPLLEKYYASAVSTAGVTNVVSLVLAVVVTLLFCWNTHNFWVWRQTYYEQPKVAFSRQVVLEVGTADGTAFRYASLPAYNSLVDPAGAVVATVAAASDDTNGDGYPDVFDVAVRGKLPASAAAVSHCNVALVFSFFLDQRIRVSATALAALSLPVGSAGALKAHAVGDLVLDPPRELAMDGATLRGYDAPVLDAAALRGPADLAFSSFVTKYAQRNITASYALRTPLVYDVPTGPGVELNLRVYVPVAALEYKPGVWESLKFALIQLISIGFVVFLIRAYILDFLYTRHIVASRVVRETAPHAHAF